MGCKQPLEQLWWLKWGSMPYGHASLFKCRYTSVLGSTATIQSAFRSPQRLCGGGLLGFPEMAHSMRANQQNVALVTNSCCCPWLQLDVTRDHLTPKHQVWEHLCSVALANMLLLNFVDCSKETINSEFNPAAFYEKLSDICYRGRKYVGTVIFLLLWVSLF